MTKAKELHSGHLPKLIDHASYIVYIDPKQRLWGSLRCVFSAVENSRLFYEINPGRKADIPANKPCEQLPLAKDRGGYELKFQYEICSS